MSFKSFLIESRSAPLYHATKAADAERILKTNTLFGSVQDDGQTKGQKVIFVTRNLKAAKHFINYDGRHAAGVVFVLDQEKLSHRYKIKPIKNWQDEREDTWKSERDRKKLKLHLPMFMHHTRGANEFEEIIIANRITNISDYITKIYINIDVNSRNPDRFPTLVNDSRVVIDD